MTMLNAGPAFALLVMARAALAGDVAPGFEGLAALPTGHPSEALSLPAVEAAARALLVDDWATYAAMIAEPGKGGPKGPDYYGSACLNGDCDAGYATLFVDPATGAVFLAWTNAGHLYFRPESEKWPDKANAAYEFWPEM